MTLRLWQALRPRLRFNGAPGAVRAAGAPAGAGAAGDGARRHQGRRRRSAAHVGRFRAAHGGDRAGHPSPRRPRIQRRLGQATGRGAVRRDEARRRQADEDRRLGHRCVGAADAGRSGPRAAGAHPGLAAVAEAEIHLCRCAGGRDQSRHRPRAHQLRAGDRLHRAAVVERSQPAEHPDPHRGRQPHPPRLHRRAGPCAGRRPTTRRSSCGCWRMSPTSPRCAKVSPAARTSMPAPRPRCSASRWRAWTR